MYTIGDVYMELVDEQRGVLNEKEDSGFFQRMEY